MPECAAFSPLLDGFKVGSSISDHNGTTCYPAIEDSTDKQYIIKVISVPASQSQMDAFLLTGAYKDPADAMDYFKHQGQELMQEAALLKRMASGSGFLCYEGWQMEPITRHRLGYQVCLIGSYKRSLDKYVRHNPVTHLEAINLGLDLCAALSEARQAGYMYVDLKPTNVYLNDKKEYRIGDLGFVSLDSLSYAVIPARYCSVYTPPELHDPMATINTTADTYAVGLILYQLYNDGSLPPAGCNEIPSPINADYELAEIIMQAIHPDPYHRWNNPADLGQALRAYMQRNTVNDDPITVHTPLEPIADTAEKDTLDSEGADQASDTSGEEASLPNSESSDETVPGEADADLLQPHEMTDELSRMVAKADDLISHETPSGVVLPEIPEAPDPFAFAYDEDDPQNDGDVPRDPVMEDPDESPPLEKKRENLFLSPDFLKRKKTVQRSVAAALAICILGTGVFLYYKNIYQKTVRDFIVDTTKDSLSVRIESDIPDEMLQVLCTDSSGKTITMGVSEGKTLFSDLQPDSTYTLQLEIDGFHGLSGKTGQTVNTDATTNISSLSSIAGASDGSVIVNFEVEGDEPSEWSITAVCDGEEPRIQSFAGHSVTVTDLTVGSNYTLQLSASDTKANKNISVSGYTELEYLASKLVLARNIALTSTDDDSLVVEWTAPGDVIVKGWTVRCYNSNGYDETRQTSQCSAVFANLDTDFGCTVEITAAGMSQPSVLELNAHPCRISNFLVSEKNKSGILELNWDDEQNAPAGGWQLSYSVDGNTVPTLITCKEPTATISPLIPGATYVFSFQAADGSAILNSKIPYTSENANPFQANKLSLDTVEGWLLKTPAGGSWSYESIDESAFTDSFLSGESVSVVLHGTTEFYMPAAEVQILYVIRDSFGNVLPELVAGSSVHWKDIWSGGDYHYGELNVPHIPTVPGSYTLEILIDGETIFSSPLQIS